jgi:hypothetical protein
MSDCFLKFTDSANKEVRIGLNDYGTFIVSKDGYHYDREILPKGKHVYIDNEIHKFIGYECNKIATNVLPKEYRRSITVKRNRSSNKSKKSNNSQSRIFNRSMSANSFRRYIYGNLPSPKPKYEKPTSPKVVKLKPKKVLTNYEKAAQFLKNNWAPK